MSSRDLDIETHSTPSDDESPPPALNETFEFYPSGQSVDVNGEGPNVGLDLESGVGQGDYDEQAEREQLELYRESSVRHHASSIIPTIGRVHLVEQMEAIDEVDRALELDELRSEVQGHPHSRALSVHHVHFNLTLSQEHRAKLQEPHTPRRAHEPQPPLGTDLAESREISPFGEEVMEIPPTEAKPDIFGAIFNLMNYALGAGILALPYAFRQAGLVMGTLLVTIVGLATIFGMFLLLSASRASHAYGYEQLARVSYGDKFAQFVKITIIIDSFGALSAYMILIADTSHNIAMAYLGTNSIWANKILILTLVTIFIMLPLCSLKNINYLGFTSALSLVPLVYFLVLQIVYLVKAGGIQPGVKLFNTQIFYALPIVIFSFSSQQALFPLYTELKERNGTERHIKHVVVWSLLLTALCYLFSGTVGQFTYPTTAVGNVLNNFPPGVAVDILLITTAISIVLSFPVILWPARVSADRLFFLDSPFSYLRFVLEAAVILALAFLIAVAVPSFSTVLGLFGSLTNTCIGYVLPPLFYIKLVPTSWKASHTKRLAIALLVIGTVLGLTAAGIITQDYIVSRIKGEKPEGE